MIRIGGLGDFHSFPLTWRPPCCRNPTADSCFILAATKLNKSKCIRIESRNFLLGQIYWIDCLMHEIQCHRKKII